MSKILYPQIKWGNIFKKNKKNNFAPCFDRVIQYKTYIIIFITP